MSGLDDTAAPRRGDEFFGATPVGSSNLRSAARSGSRWSAVQQAGGRLVALLVFLVLARLLGPADFGLVALATVFVGVLQILVEGGFGQAIIQRRDLHRGHADTVFWASVAIAVVLAGALCLAATPLSIALNEPRLAAVLFALAPALLVSALGVVQSALLRRNLQFRPLAMRAIASNFAGGCVGLVAAFLGLGVWALVLQYLVLSVVQTVLLWISTPWVPGRSVSRAAFRDIFAFSRNSLGNQFLMVTDQRSDDLLIGTWLGSVLLGIYSVAYRLIRVMTEVINYMLLTVALPVFSRLQDDRERLARVYRTVLALSAAIAFPSYLFFVVAAPDVVLVLFGEQWSAAAPIMQILAVCGALQATLDITDACLTAIGKPQIVFRNRLAATIVQVGAFAIAAPFGLIWVAIALVARTYLMAPFPVWSLRRAGVITFRGWLGCFVTPVVASAAMLLAMTGISMTLDGLPAELRLLVMTPVGALVYFTALWVLDRRLVRELYGVVRRKESVDDGRAGTSTAEPAAFRRNDLIPEDR